MRAACAFFVLFFAASEVRAADPATAQTKSRLEIEGLLKRHSAAERSGDAASLASCYEEDGLLLPSSGEPVRGRVEIARRYQAIFVGKSPRTALDPEELWVMGDFAVSRGTARGPSNQPHKKGPLVNRYVMTLQRNGETWEIQSLVWNSGAVSTRP